ncbi:MAG: hypothetical protein K6B68_08135 [Eubacterium sp.]|nr:hypothetical protein [Eubacterium sp.]
MSQIIMAICCFVIYLLIYYLVGVAASKLFRLENSPVQELIYGMFFYGIIYFIYVLPMKFYLVPLDVIGKIWLVFISVLCVLILNIFRKYIAKSIENGIKSFKEHKALSLVVTIFTAAQITFIEIICRLVNGFNQVWFVGWVSTGVFNNELMTHDVASGLELSVFNNDRYLCTFLDHSAMVCKLTGMHTMVEVRTVLTAVFVLMESLVVWELAKYLGKDSDTKKLLIFFLYWAFSNLMVGSQLLPGYFTFFRTYEGKGFVMNVPIPLMMLLLWKMYDTPEDWGLLWKSAIVLWGSMTYSLSMMFTFPFVLAGWLPFLLVKKDKKVIKHIVAMGVVCMAFFAVFYLGRTGKIDLTIYR